MGGLKEKGKEAQSPANKRVESVKGNC